MGWLKDIRQFLLPIHCINCKCQITEASQLFCVTCYSYLPKTDCFKVEYNICYNRFVEDGFHLNYVAALFYFEEQSPLKSVMHLLKYQGKTDIGYHFGEQLGRQINNVNALQDVDVIIPMPLHQAKFKLRGYNQSSLIAQGIHSITGVFIDFEAVIRLKNTKSQTKMNKAQRQVNVNSAFSWVKDFPKGTHFLVVDDVLTTGASVQSLITAFGDRNMYKFSVICIGYTR